MIVDDNPHEVQLLKMYVERQVELSLVAIETNAYEAQRFLLQNEIDLLLLDVEMPGMDGLELYGSLPDPPLVIFHTAHDRFAVNGFDFGAVDFLVKNMHYERFVKAIKRALDDLAQARGKQTEASLLEEVPDDYLFLYDREDKVLGKVPLSEIFFVEVRQHDFIVYFKEETKIYNSSLKANLPKLLGAGFIQVNRSFVVRKSVVYGTDGKDVLLWHRKERIRLSATYAGAFLAFFENKKD